MRYIKRTLEKVITKYTSIFPVVALTGPRQSGKSTLLLHLLKDKYQYVSFDDYRVVNLFYDDPEKFMRIYSDKVIFDEAQKAPEIFNYIKIAVDKNRTAYGKFILSGSSQFTLLSKVTESLAGRIGLLTLLPFQYTELPSSLRNRSIYKGTYPELVMRQFQHSDEWYDAYVETYLNKDVRNITKVGDLRDFRRFIGLVASRTAKTLNLSALANDLGVAVSTVKRWLSILEASYIIFLLPPYYKNLGKRITKSPKLYFYDTGLACFLTGVKNKDLYEHGPMAGAIFENYIIAETLKRILHQKDQADLFFYRTSHGAEIDLIIDYKSRRDLIEIKKSATFKPRMTKTIEAFIGKKDKGFLIYDGQKFPYLKNISVIPYSQYLTHSTRP
jgi:predicted AAA+ superfamily ATPase